MKIIGILFGMEQSFPPALVERINSYGEGKICAEFVKIGAVTMEQVLKYDVILDRISHDVPFYRSVLKVAVLQGIAVVNDPFWWSADDKFFGYTLMQKLGVPIPRTAILPSKAHPPNTTSESFRNLIYPLNWDEIFHYVGFPAFLKPHTGGGWKQVYYVRNPEEFFHAYDQTGDTVMVLQSAIEYQEYYRCYVVGQHYVHIMPYEPRNPHHLRYVADYHPSEQLRKQMHHHCLTIAKTLGYEFLTVEFAVQDGVPYAIDFLNPAPDAELYSVKEENFEWIVEHSARFLIEKAKRGRKIPTGYPWSGAMSRIWKKQQKDNG